ncbi:MAG: hypothetical protein WC829_02335 [Hyphomicrobium sp.]|jgi:hypothetical protein
MAGNSVIGALRVDLGLNSAQFTTGLKKVETGLASFGKMAGLGLAAFATAATAAAIALGVAVKNSIDHADALSKTSQKIGVSVEALSRLEYAAKLSDVSLEGLSDGLKKLSVNMQAAAVNSKSGPAVAFQALGISVKDASGNLRASDAVFSDVADRFARMEDGALKTSLAVQIFGKSGADLIPLLNSGKAGLAAMAAESDRLGITIGTRTAQAAEAFNDTLTRIGAAMGGVANKVMETALPSLQSLADTLASPEFARAAAALADAVVGALNLIVQAATATINALSAVATAMDKNSRMQALHGGNTARPGTNEWQIQNSSDRIGTGASWGDFARQFNVGSANADPIGGGASFGQLSAFGNLNPLIPGAAAATRALEPLNIGIEKVGEGLSTIGNIGESIATTLADGFSNIADAALSGGDAMKALASELGNIGKQLLSAGLNMFFKAILGGGFGGGGMFTGNFNIGGMPSYASGTDFHPGGLARIGERGPEIVNLPRGSQVFPNGQGPSGGGGGSSVVRIELGPGLVGQILSQAGQQTVQIVQAQVPGMISTQAPLAVGHSQRNNRGG